MPNKDNPKQKGVEVNNLSQDEQACGQEMLVRFTTPDRPFLIKPEPRRFVFKRFHVHNGDGVNFVLVRTREIVRIKGGKKFKEKAYAKLLSKYK